MGPNPEPLQTINERELALELQNMDAFAASFIKSLDAAKAKAEEAVQARGKFGKLKSALREAEDEFVKVLTVKTRKEAKQVEMKEIISATKERIEETKRAIQVQRSRQDEYRVVVSEQSLAYRKGNQDMERKVEFQEVMSWYNKVLGLQIESGRGVKFTFNNIDPKNPHAEYTFTIRYEHDMYTLLSCDPQLNDMKELIIELNKTNGLFGFVRTMRQKFQEAASLGCSPQYTVVQQESSTVSTSAPVFSVSTDGSDTPMKNDEHPHVEKRNWKHGKGTKQAILSPGSVCQSPRFKAKK